MVQKRIRPDRVLTKRDEQVMKYLTDELYRLKTAHKNFKAAVKIKASDGTFLSEVYKKQKRIEIEAQYHNLSTVASIVNEIFLRGLPKHE